MTGSWGVCPLCEKGVFSTVYVETRDAITREPFTVVECNHCAVKRTIPVPSDLRPYYDNDIGSAMRSRTSRLHNAMKEVLLGIECRRIERMSTARTAIDVGCGAGEFAKALFRRGWTVHCADSSPSRPPELESTPLPYHIFDYETYAIEGLGEIGKNVLLLRHVIEHIKEPRLFLERMIGYNADAFYVVVPNTAALKNRILGQYNYALDVPRHLWHFSRKPLEMLFCSLGIDVVAHGYDTIPTFFPSLYRFLRLNGWPRSIYRHFAPKGALSAASFPLDLLLPNDVLWMIGKLK